MSYFKFQMFASLGFRFNEAAKQQGGAGTAEIDEIKRMLVETNPYFLLLTATVSVLHVVYVYLFISVIYHANQWILLVDSRCWPLRMMSLIGERRTNSRGNTAVGIWSGI